MNANDTATDMVIAALVAAQSADFAYSQRGKSKATKASKAPKGESALAKAKREAREARDAEKDEPLHVPSVFPMADPLTPEAFMTVCHDTTREQCQAVWLPACHGFVAWLRETKNARIGALTPAMAPGDLLSACLRIVYVMVDEAYLVQADLSNRDGPTYVPGFAGVNAKALKYLSACKALHQLCENAAMQHRENMVAKREIAEELATEGEFSEAQALLQEAEVHDRMYQIESQRAQDYVDMVNENDYIRMSDLYDRMGGSDVIEVDMVGWDLGSLGAGSRV